MGARACGLQPGGPLAALRARAWRLTTLASRRGAACPRPGRRGLARCLRRLPSCSPRLPQPPAGSGDALGRPAPGVSREQSAPGAAAWGPARGATWWGRAARSSRSRAVVPEGSSPSPRRVRGFASLRRLKPAEGAASCPWRAGGCLTGRGDRHTCGRLGMAPAPRLLKSPPPSPGTPDRPGPQLPLRVGQRLFPPSCPGQQSHGLWPQAGQPPPTALPAQLCSPTGASQFQSLGRRPDRPRPGHGALVARLRGSGPQAGQGLIGLSGDPTVGPGVCPLLGQDVPGPWEGRRRAEPEPCGVRGVLAHLPSPHWPFGPETRIVVFRGEVISVVLPKLPSVLGCSLGLGRLGRRHPGRRGQLAATPPALA